MQELPEQALAARIERLERRLKLFVVGASVLVLAVIVLASIVFWWASTRPVTLHTLRVHRLEVIDALGATRAGLEAPEEGARLELFDGLGNIAILAAAPDIGPALYMVNVAAKSGSRLMVGEDGPELNFWLYQSETAENPLQAVLKVSRAGPALSLSDAKGIERVLLQVRPVIGKDIEGPLLRLFDADAELRAQFMVAPWGPALGLFDTSGRTTFSAP